MSILHSIAQYVKKQVSIRPGTYTAATVTGETIDTKGASSIAFFLDVNAISSSSGTPSLDVKIQESADGQTNWADISAGTSSPTGYTGQTASAFPNNATRADNLVLALDLSGKRARFLRAYATQNGVSPSHQFGVGAVLGPGLSLPAETVAP